MNNAELIARSVKAKAILESEIYQESWELCRANIFAQIESTPVGDLGTLAELHRYLKLLNSAKGNLELFLRRGKKAEVDLMEAEAARSGKVQHLFRP